TIRFKIFASTGGFNRSQAMVGVVQHVNLRAKLFTQSIEQLRNESQVMLGGPLILWRCVFLGGLVKHLAAPYAVGAVQPGNSRLRSHGLIPQLNVVSDGFDCLLEVGATGMTIDEHRFTRCAS